MHFPRVSREVLMLPASFSLSPNVLVLLHLSEPARSHRENLRRGGRARERCSTTAFLPLPQPYSDSHFTAASSIFSSFKVKMLWLRGEPVSVTRGGKHDSNNPRNHLLLEDWFIFVAAALLFLLPYWSSLNASNRVWMLTHLRSANTERRWSRPPRPPTSNQETTFNVSVPGAVVAHSQRRALPGLGAQRRLEQVVHALVVDFEERHPQGELAAAGFCRDQVTRALAGDDGRSFLRGWHRDKR